MASNTGKPWTKKEDAALRRLWGKVSDEKITKELKRSEKDVIDRAVEIKLPPCRRRNAEFPWTSESDARLRLMWGDSSESSIRASLGRTSKGIIVRARELALPPQSQGMSPIKSVSRRLGIHGYSLHKYLVSAVLSHRVDLPCLASRRLGFGNTWLTP